MLSNTKKYTVGRLRDSDLSLSDDISVSREHAVIYRSSSGVRVEDKGSKYGVFINEGIDTNTEVPKNTTVDIHAGNIIRFGRSDNTFRLENIDINVCTSAMSSEENDKLIKQLKIVDGQLHSVWSTECTHLVMTNVTITVKVLQSLAHGVPIVSPDYFDAYIKCATEHQPELPDVKKFIPIVVEPYLMKDSKMMEVHLERQRLFQNKIFVFMVKRHMEKFEPIITLAAGKCINMEEAKVRKNILLKSEYIPVQYTASNNSQCSSDIEKITEYIQSNDRRLINESEISLSIIHRDIDRFCNPDRKLTILPESVNTNEYLKNILEDASHPQEANPQPQEAPNSIVIPESVTLTGSELNNNRSGEAIDLEKPSTSSTTRRSTRSSTKSTTDEVFVAPKKIPTPKKNQKRKISDQNEPSEPASIQSDQRLPEKKQKTLDAAESQGESSSAHFVAPLLPQSQSVHNFSGFISTQSRKRKATQERQQQQQEIAASSTPESSTVARKRAIRMLDADSDEEKDDDGGGNIFKFSRKSKRSKVTTKGTQKRAPQRNTLDDSDEDEGESNFNFTQRRPRQSPAKQKRTQASVNDAVDAADAADVAESQNSSYKKPFQQTMHRSFNRTIQPIELKSMPEINVAWISLKMKNELNLDESKEESSKPSSSVKVKDEKLEEWELTKEEQKRQWIKSMAGIFKVRKVELNITRHSVADETDSLFSESGNSSLNKTKNFKKFVKVFFLGFEDGFIYCILFNPVISFICRKITTSLERWSSKRIQWQLLFQDLLDFN